MSTATSVAKGAIWNYSAQIGTVLAQLAYAAATSRLLGADLFGVFAAALASAALINLLALAGLPQIIGRMTELVPGRLAGLLVYAAGVGVAAAAILIATADLWALIWGVPEAAPLIRLLSITSLLTPLVAVANGLHLRLGRFRRLATVTVVGNVGGMAVGVAVVALTRDSAALAVSQIVSQLVISTILLIGARASFRGRPNLGSALSDIRYSGRSIVSGLLSYAAGTVGKVAATQGFGTTPLGNWNRAEAITTTPFYQLGAALTQAVYPEFRHDIESRERTRRVWSDILAIIGWVCVPLGAALAVIAPFAVGILLGPGWTQAGQFAAILAVIGSLQPVVFLLVSGFEALGRFSWIWAGYIISVVVNVAGAAIALLVGSIWPIFAGTLVSFVLMHALHLTLATRDGLVDPRRVARHYLEIAAFTLYVAGILAIIVNAATIWAVSPWLLAAAVALILGIGALIWQKRAQFPPFVLAQRYGLFRR